MWHNLQLQRLSSKLRPKSFKNSGLKKSNLFTSQKLICCYHSILRLCAYNLDCSGPVYITYVLYIGTYNIKVTTSKGGGTGNTKCLSIEKVGFFTIFILFTYIQYFSKNPMFELSFSSFWHLSWELMKENKKVRKKICMKPRSRPRRKWRYKKKGQRSRK